jgi:cardiolipin synthase (CMP-forming)
MAGADGASLAQRAGRMMHRMPGSQPPSARSGDLSVDRVLTVPNALSAIRIAAIPLFVVLILHPGSEAAGLVLFALTMATDWVDGFVARRTGQVSNLGKILDPLADRLAIAAGLIALVVQGAFPLWAAVLILARDVIVLVAGLILAGRRRIRIDVRWIGKIATFALMFAVWAISWSNLGLAVHALLGLAGWVAFWFGIVLYYAALFFYARDVRAAIRDHDHERPVGEPAARGSEPEPRPPRPSGS